MIIRHTASVTLAVAALTSAILGSTAAVAGTPGERVTVTAPRTADETTARVSFADLDLTLAADQRRLDRRVDGAIRDVCGASDYYAARTLTNFAHYRICAAKASDSAQSQMEAAIARASNQFAGGGNAVASMAILVSARSGD
jgi:UrcA family protein